MEEPASDSIRVVSVNLCNGGTDPEELARLLREIGPDVFAAQELTPEQCEALRAALPHGLFAPARDHRGMALALRRPASVRRVALPCRDALVADLAVADWPGLPADGEILNVHIQAPHTPPPWRALPRRRRQVAALARYLSETREQRRVLVGDLNATPSWPAYRALRAHLRDAAHEAARRGGVRPEPTWAPRAGARRLLRIDHVLVNRFEVRSVRVVPVSRTDHGAVVADLR